MLKWRDAGLAGDAAGGPDAGTPVADGGDAGIPDGSTSSVTCLACATSSDCGALAACAQYGGSDYCANICTSPADCAATETCVAVATFDGVEVQGCVPQSANCSGMPGCLACPSGTSCDYSTGTCVSPPPDGGPATRDGGTCGTLVPPSIASCCTSCTAGGANCQPNGCYGGWWCDTATCRCQAPPSTCGGGSLPDGGGTGPCIQPTTSSCCHSCTPGVGDCQANGCYGGWLCDTATCLCQSPQSCGVAADGGTPSDGGTGTDAGSPTGVGPNGGTVTSLYFAVVGDTRPASIDDTANYPTAIIDTIFQDLDAMTPKPQFVISTGDYMFASPTGSQGAAQVQLYTQAVRLFSNVVFPVLGDQECNTYTSGNCASSPTNNYNAYMSALVTPIGKSAPYYAIPIRAVDGSWTAKIVVVACNAWGSAQQTWLQAQLATPTTYTFVARHEPSTATNAPCVSTVDSMLAGTTYDLLVVGHSHTFANPAYQELVVGNGGAPLSGAAGYGYATIAQQPSQGFVVTQYDYLTALPVASFTVP